VVTNSIVAGPVAHESGQVPDPVTFAAAASQAAWRRSASIVTPHTAGTIISVVTVDAPGRYAAVAVARAIVSGALRQQAPHPASKPSMTAAARGLSEHPLPDLVIAGCAGDPHVTHAPAALGSLPGSHAVAGRGFSKRCRQQEARGAVSRDSSVILDCQRSLLAKVSDFPAKSR
jgi:hypothetical protein